MTALGAIRPSDHEGVIPSWSAIRLKQVDCRCVARDSGAPAVLQHRSRPANLLELTLYFRDIRASAWLDGPRQHMPVGRHPLLRPPPGVIWEGAASRRRPIRAQQTRRL